jgi:hypothetical protein
MDHVELLFAKYDFHSALRNAPLQLVKAIEGMTDSELEDAASIDTLVAAHSITVPVLDTDAVTPSEHEVDVDVRHDPGRFVLDRNRACYVKMTAIDFRVPFRGEADVFRCRPSTFSMNPPRAQIDDSAIVVRVVRQDHNASEYRKEFDRIIGEIKRGLEQLRADSVGLEKTLRETASTHLARRREKRQKDRGLIDGLGFGKPRSECK